MVDAKRLLTDLKRLHRDLSRDLREQHAASAQRDAAQTEWREAFDAKRTADTFETFWTAAIDQASVHWILGVVFIRFLEDNRLLDQPFLSGPGERLELAQARQAAYVRAKPLAIDTDFVLDTFAESARLPGLAGLYDQAHNPLFRLPLSGDGAIALIAFCRARVPETGALLHDFTDADWNTRFLGDLYQDLSEDARKRFALLQTPEFVEEWILDRTLDPAMREFGHVGLRMIDPACGSGHFLLGGFARVLAAWQREVPDMPPAAQAQLALDSVSGVDLNPFAVEIARFRLLLVALQTAGETRLAAAPNFRISLAVGDSLLHGQHFGRQRDLALELREGFQRRLRHHFATEDTAELDDILGRQYHAVVGNPPYITPKDPAMRDAYREIFVSCHMKYGLGVPFIERFFDLAQIGNIDQAAGFIGVIVGNTFMKREFGAKLIHEVFPRLDLTYVVDTSSTYIPGHTTPTVILFGRNRPPISQVVRTIRVTTGAPKIPEVPSEGPVWKAIVAQTDIIGSKSEFISVEDTPRAILSRHPWSLGGGGATGVKTQIENGRPVLGRIAAVAGVFGMTNADDIMLSDERAFTRARCETNAIRPLVVGDAVRDWRIISADPVIFPYQGQELVDLALIPQISRWLWPARTTMGNRATFGQRTYFVEGRPWWEWHQVAIERLDGFTITFAFVATHNHFVLDRGGKVFNRTAPVIKLPAEATDDDHLRLLGSLNSSVGCFWMKQVMMDKGGGGVGGGLKSEYWDRLFEFTATNLMRFPLAGEHPIDLTRILATEAERLSANLPTVIFGAALPTRSALDAARSAAEEARAIMIATQEELDWQLYRHYGLHEHPPEHNNPPPLRLGERAFEIVMARRLAAGEFETAWFARHGSTPITGLPSGWAEDYRAVVEQRIELIESDPTIGLIERPEYKRRWSMESWEKMEHEALRTWLLDRLETQRYWRATAPNLTSTHVMADAIRHDADFQTVALLYAGTEVVDLDVLIGDLVTREAVPFLPALRYSETGLRKRADWEMTWDKQRQEDAVDAEVATHRDRFLREVWSRANPRQTDDTTEAYMARMAVGPGDEATGQSANLAIAAKSKHRKQEEVGAIPVPPKYKAVDFISTDFWRLRGGLDVPKERFISFPHCARDGDGSLPILWAGYDHLARAKAIAAWYVERKDIDGWASPRLIPLLAGLLELVPWLLQWHNDLDPETGVRMGDYFAGFIDDEARDLGVTLAEIRAWTPPAPVRRTRRRSTAT